MQKLFLGLTTFALLSFTLFALDPGGVKYDFSTIPAPRSAGTTENLFKFSGFEEETIDFSQGRNRNIWGGSQVVHSPEKDELTNALRNELKQLVKRLRSTDNPYSGKYCAAIINPPDIQKKRDAEGKPMISNRINQSLAFPALEQPQKFRLSLRLRGKLEAVPGLNSFRVFALFHGADRKETRKMLNHEFSMSAQWEERSVEFNAPAGTTTLTISIALYGIGEAYIDDVKLEKTTMSNGVTAKVMPYAFLDKTFAMGENLAAAVVFSFNNETEAKCEKLCLAVKLPPGFSIINAANMTSLGIDGDVHRFNLMQLRKTISRDFYSGWNVATLLLKSDMGASDKLFPLEYWMEDGEYRSPVETVSLKIIPSLKGETPKQFVSAAMYGRELQYNDPAAVEAIIKFYRDSGFNAIHGGNFPPLLNKAFKDAGIVRYMQPFSLCNGYRIGNTPKPPEALFRLVDGSPWTKPNEKICPVEVYKRGNYYRNDVVKMLEDILVTNDRAEHIMPNWEPYYLDFKGCFCDRCKEEFIKYAAGKIKADDINNAWPKDIISSYRETWIKFRSWQHGRLMAQLEKTVQEIGKKAGKDSHFIPEIAWTKMLPGKNSDFGQYDVLDYINDLPWLEPWGPYIFHRFTQNYEYYPGLHLRTWNAAGVIRKFADDNAKKTPKIIAFPHAYQLEDWITEPEALAFEFLCFFLNHWDGAIGYRFPRGFDYRYWKAITEANTAITRHEDFVFRGKNIVTQVKVTPETPLPEPFFPVLFTQQQPGLAKSAILQYKAFQYEEQYMVAVGNFWQKGENFFKVQLNNLSASQRYGVSLNEDFLGNFTGKELSRGILAQVGGLRWSFITIGAPADKAVVYSQDQISALMKKRLPEIEKALKWENEYRQKHQSELSAENPVNDFSAILPLNGDGVELKAAAPYLNVTTAKYQLKIDPGNGGRIAEWQADNTPLICQENKLSMAIDAFWWPKEAATQITSGYKITNLQADDAGIKVILERIVSQRDNHYLSGLKITKTYLFSAREITVNTQIDNPTDRNIDFSFRYHNLPAFLSTRDGKSGMATFGDGQSFTRDLLFKLYAFASPDPDLEKAFRMDKSFKTSSSKVTFSAPWTPLKISAEAPAELLQYFVFWDSGKQPSSTFEPIFKKTQLNPGAKVSYQLQWSME